MNTTKGHEMLTDLDPTARLALVRARAAQPPASPVVAGHAARVPVSDRTETEWALADLWAAND